MRRRKHLVVAASYLLLLVTIAASFLRLGPVSDISIWLAIFVGGALLGGGLRLAIRRVATVNDPRLLGPLLQSLEVKEPDVREIALESIRRILPTVGHGQVSLTQGEEQSLSRLLLQTKDADLASRILGFQKMQGLHGSIPAIERVAEGHSALERDEGDKLANLARMALADIRMMRAREIIDASSEPEPTEARTVRLNLDDH